LLTSTASTTRLGTTMAANIRVWVRLQHQSREEAIKLLLPRDGSDVSDVLLKVPGALNVSGYRPSELALHLALTTSDGQEAVEVVPLSNRMSLESLLAADDDNEINMVVASKEGTSVLLPPDAMNGSRASSANALVAPNPTTRPRQSGHVTTSAPKVSSLPLGRSRSPAPKIPPPAPKPAAPTPTSSSARGSSPFRRTASSTASTTNISARGAAPTVNPTSARAASAQRTSSAPRSSSAQRQTIARTNQVELPVVGAAPQRPAVSGVRRASPSRASVGPPSANSSPRPVAPVPKLPSRQAQPLVPSCATRPTAATQRKAASAVTTTVPSHQQTVTPPLSVGVCATFKPQWGNVLCAACKHSRQAHDIRQQQQRQLTRLATSSMESTPTRSDPLHRDHVDPNHNLDHGRSIAGARYSDTDMYMLATGLSTSPTPSSSGGNKSCELNLLDPPVVNNLSLGSPDGPMFDRN
jgi:hypothetical protein